MLASAVPTELPLADYQLIRTAMRPDENYLSYIISDRRTIHSFTAEVVDPSIVSAAVNCARWAPNHKMTEPWRVIMVGPQTASKIVDLNTRLVSEKRGGKSAASKRARWAAVPNWLAITSAKSADAVRTKEDYAATCCFIQNLSLYLWSKRIGVKWTTGAVTRYNDVYELLDVDPEKEDVVGLLWYGYPSEVQRTAKRQSAEQILRHLP